jgi:hypothetical protein
MASASEKQPVTKGALAETDGVTKYHKSNVYKEPISRIGNKPYVGSLGGVPFSLSKCLFYFFPIRGELLLAVYVRSMHSRQG